MNSKSYFSYIFNSTVPGWHFDTFRSISFFVSFFVFPSLYLFSCISLSSPPYHLPCWGIKYRDGGWIRLFKSSKVQGSTLRNNKERLEAEKEVNSEQWIINDEGERIGSPLPPPHTSYFLCTYPLSPCSTGSTGILGHLLLIVNCQLSIVNFSYPLGHLLLLYCRNPLHLSQPWTFEPLNLWTLRLCAPTSNL